MKVFYIQLKISEAEIGAHLSKRISRNEAVCEKHFFTILEKWFLAASSVLRDL